MPLVIQSVSFPFAPFTFANCSLFSPIESDDARHDEALSSRIAALNMLDLSLDHLGLITRPDDAPAGEENVIADGLVKVVDSIGDGKLLPLTTDIDIA